MGRGKSGSNTMELKKAYQVFFKNKEWGKALDCLQLMYLEGDYESLLSFREKMTKEVEKDALLYRVLKKSYLISAKDKFEDFLIVNEWDRPFKAKFYLPRRAYLKPIVDAYQEVADGKLQLLTISLVKRAGKSQLGINFALFMSGRRPQNATLMEGAGDALINSFYKGCLEYLTDPQYSYYDIFPTAKICETNADLHVINLQTKSRFPTIMCRSIDATQVGLSEATNLLYLDDCVEGYIEAQNRRRLDEKWNTINGDILGRAIEGTPIVACGTRYSLYDNIGRLQEMADEKGWKWKKIEIPALDDDDKSNYEFYSPSLERQVFTSEYFINERKSLSPQQFAAEFQQQPFEAKGVLFPERDLKRFFELPADVEPDSVLAVCDTAEGGGDSTAVPIAYIYGEDVFIMDVVFDNSTPEYTKPEVATKLVEHNVSVAVFESNLAGTYYARDVDEMVRKMGGRCSIRTKRTLSNKRTRIELASAGILEHFYFLDKSLYEPNSQYARFMKEIVNYTRTGKVAHDDAPDSLSLLENQIRELVMGKVEILKRFF